MAGGKPTTPSWRDVAESLLGRDAVDSLHEIMQIARAAVPMFVRLTAIAAACGAAYREAGARASDLDTAMQSESSTVDDWMTALAPLQDNPLALQIYDKLRREREANKVHTQEKRKRSTQARIAGKAQHNSTDKILAEIRQEFSDWKINDPGRHADNNDFADDAVKRHPGVAVRTIRNHCSRWAKEIGVNPGKCPAAQQRDSKTRGA